METVAQAAARYRATVDKQELQPVEKGSGFKIAFNRCDSPIEQAFCLSLFQVPGIFAIEGDYRPSLARKTPKNRGILVFAQNPILRFRADFLLVAMSPLKAEPAFLIVECDGEQYHSLQYDVDRDQARAEELRGTGFQIVRHTGREIYQDPRGVVARTLAALVSHGWGPDDARQWVDHEIVQRAFMELAHDDPGVFLGHKATTFRPLYKPLNSAISAMLQECERNRRPRR